MLSVPHAGEPTLADVEAARDRIAGHAVRTPLLESPLFNARVDGRVLVKPECLQRTGSFKFRGAFNKLSKVKAAGVADTVVAYSSGNHAQGVAASAGMLGLKAVIVMPSDAPLIKVANTRAYGAEVILYDRQTENREAIGQALARERGAVLVPPYDDGDVIAGQGTIGLELIEDAAARGIRLDAVVCCCGGGGLIAGLSLAVKGLAPDVPIYAAEPVGFDDTRRSLESGQRERIDPEARSICDAILTPTPGEITFSVNGRLLSGGYAVSDAEVAAAMRAAFGDFKLVVEPGGAVALAAVLAGKAATQGRTVGVILSGGNVDADLFARVLNEAI
jgi:threonine dehydratase